MKKKIAALLPIVLVISCSLKAQLPSYTLPVPQGWKTEKFTLPPAFAPEVNLKGKEDIRFMPGWSKATASDYWSYAFLWLVGGKPALDTRILGAYMAAYYNGLYLSNLGTKPKPKPGFTSALFTKENTADGDKDTFIGSVTTLNFLDGKPLDLHVRVHVRKEPSAAATAMLFEISPKPLTDHVWVDLRNLTRQFQPLP